MNTKPQSSFLPSEPFSRRQQTNEASSYVVINNGQSSKYIRISSGKEKGNVEIEFKEEKNQNQDQNLSHI